MNITFNGDPITLVGEKIKVGDNAPDFLVVDNNLKNVTLSDTSGKRIFITVPSIFKSMPYGNILSTLFFLSIIFAAISSSVNMLEGPVEAIISATKLNRKTASILITLVAFILAVPLSINIDKFNNFTDFITIIL